LQVILQASLLESGGRPVTRRAEQAIWPAPVLPGIRPQFARKRFTTTAPIPPSTSRLLMKTVTPV
jgi:uncharacterized protein YfaS (alpha-2-macroglobulin family)